MEERRKESVEVEEAEDEDGLECMICAEKIGRKCHVWQCVQCHGVFDIECITEWSKRQSTPVDRYNLPFNELVALPPQELHEIIMQHPDDIVLAALLQNSLTGRGRVSPPPRRSSPTPEKKVAWYCPGCRYVYFDPPVATCFCGKVQTQDPRNRQMLRFFRPAHCCGQQCGKKRIGTNCPHPCTALCHPGKCPPCPALAPPMNCFCGRQQFRFRCSEVPIDHATGKPGVSCGEICGKRLSCRTHTCQKRCHSGDCGECEIEAMQKCYCGKVEMVKKCCELERKWIDKDGTVRYFSCKEVCGKTLECGHHTCQEPCHPGPCKKCALLPECVTHCPCGKTLLADIPDAPAREACTDAIPTCGRICGKKLPNCEHTCTSLCHEGECPPCTAQYRTTCRCGTKTDILTRCSSGEPPLCDTICKRKLSCKRHRCKEKCCPSYKDPNDEAGVHVCMMVCNRPLKCGNHTCQMLCHTGVCPTCDNVSTESLFCACGKTFLPPPIPCGTKPPVCVHPCLRERPCGHVEPDGSRHSCHFGECPPCRELVTRPCDGGHMLMNNIQCGRKTVSCGKPCGRDLPCGVHKCTILCHPGECPTYQPVTGAAIPLTSLKEQRPAGYKMPFCGHKCGKPRLTCGHQCQEPCHGDTPCPNVPCPVMYVSYCKCGRKSQEVVCGCVDPPQEVLDEISSSTASEYSSTGMCAAMIAHRRSAVKVLECDELCEITKRQNMLAEAFGYQPENPLEIPKYDEFLVQYMQMYPDIILTFEKEFADFLKSGEMSRNIKDLTDISMKVCRKLCRFYGMKDVVIDPRVNPELQINRSPKSRVPSMALSEYVNSGLCSRKRVEAPTDRWRSFKTDAEIDEEKSEYVLRLSSPVRLDKRLIATTLSGLGAWYDVVYLDGHNAMVLFRSMQDLVYIKNSLLQYDIVKD